MSFDLDIMAALNQTFKNDIETIKLCPDIRGKSILLVGPNGTGKTKQAMSFPNPILIPFENGSSGLKGGMKLNCPDWPTFVSHVERLTSNKILLEKLKQTPITIVLDNIKNSGILCQRFLERKYGIQDIAEGIADNSGKSSRKINAYGFYEKEYWGVVSKLFNTGYTVVATCHVEEVTDKAGNIKLVPDKDKRSVGVWKDNCDVVAFLTPNGLDEDDKPLHSSAYLVETDDFFAKTRFSYSNTYIEDFTAQNLIDNIVEGIQREIEETGAIAVTYEEMAEMNEQKEENTKDSVIEEIENLYEKLDEKNDDDMDCWDELLNSELNGKDIYEATENQVECLLSIKYKLESYIERKSNKKTNKK